jgi:hypothetical protein
VLTRLSVGDDAGPILEQLHGFAELGIQEAHATVEDVYSLRPLEILGEKVIPEVAAL